MAIFLGLDLGTTTITALALRSDGRVVGIRSVRNESSLVGALPQPAGRSEFDAEMIFRRAMDCVCGIVDDLGPLRNDVAAVGITGQQHGVVVVDNEQKPLTPFINWQDRRGDEIDPPTGRTWLDLATERLGVDAWRRTGCRMATGYLGLTLFWLKCHGQLPAAGKACFIMDFLAARFCDCPPRTDPTCAASGGIFNVHTRRWDADAVAGLGLDPALLPEIAEATEPFGHLSKALAREVGLAEGTLVFGPLGDQQASFLGSVAARDACGHLNVGTGAQFAAYTEANEFELPLELRPFPVRGNLLTGAVLCGGWSLQLLDRFFRRAGRELFGLETERAVYEQMTQLAAGVPAGSDGLRCRPLFAGTRAEPHQRAEWLGMSERNFTPGHLARALLEGMAREYHAELVRVEEQLGCPLERLVGTGNAVRESPLFQGIIAAECGVPLAVPKHREEAAFGAALVAAVGAGEFRDLGEAGRLVDAATLGGESAP